ncbi:hypothetical protein [Streptomyces sp. NPDC007856]|uniref:hypothetical protein n=1 Tax=Streptomyces sp. NPDC007856 TaxID=3364781 RepID=UPI00368ECD8F
MDSIAARAVASVDTDTIIDTDLHTCSSQKDLTSAAEGTDNAMTTASLSHSEGRQGRSVLVLLVAMATGLTAWLFAAGAASIGAVTGAITALVAVLTGLGKINWLLGHGRRDDSAREGLRRHLIWAVR